MRTTVKSQMFAGYISAARRRRKSFRDPTAQAPPSLAAPAVVFSICTIKNFRAAITYLRLKSPDDQLDCPQAAPK